MRIGLHDADAEHMKGKKFPNYALMKIAAYEKSKGNSVAWWNPIFTNEFDTIYSSKIFDFTEESFYLPEEITIKGGTGYNAKSALPPQVDDMFPDYSIYPACDYAIGFITRGCIRNCPWCVVPIKEGAIKPYRRWEDLVRHDSKKLVLMDNNILACEYGISQLESLAGHGYKIDLNQGMDARLFDERIADICARLDWIEYIRFSCDTLGQIEAIHNAISLLSENGVKPYKVFVYMLITKDIEDAARRVEALKHYRGIHLYAQAERNASIGIHPNAAQLEFARRYVYGGKFRTESWLEYCHRRNLDFSEVEK